MSPIPPPDPSDAALDLAALWRLHEAATKEPWSWGDRRPNPDMCQWGAMNPPTSEDNALWGGPGGTVQVHTDGSACGEYSPDIDVRGPDAALIPAARNALPALLRRLAAAEVASGVIDQACIHMAALWHEQKAATAEAIDRALKAEAELARLQAERK